MKAKSKQIHDSYGKELLSEILGRRFKSGRNKHTKVNYGSYIPAFIDGVINNCCAIEIESRVDKQVRGALLDLLQHELSKKLLILIPAHMRDPEATAGHCKYILKKYKKKRQTIKVILLKGTGDKPQRSVDKERIKKALTELGCL